MHLRTLFFAVLSGLCFSCEDILEEPDISTQSVTILAPTEGAILNGNQINFNWDAFEEARSYRVQVATPSFVNATQFILDSLIVKDTLGNLRNNISQGLLNGNYQWRVKALNGGFETLYTESNFQVQGDPDVDLVSPNTPILVGPIDNTTQDETEVNFSWTREDINGSTEGDSIYIYTDDTLQNLELKGLGANKTFNADLTSNTYYWLVQAFDAAGNKSADSTVFVFTIN